MPKYDGIHITGLEVRDVRFPTSVDFPGALDSMIPQADFSSAYCTLTTNSKHTGYGMAFTMGRGNDIMVKTIQSLKQYIVGKNLTDIYENFGTYCKTINNDGQLRWLGPEKGAIHMAVSAILNALWDLWGKIESKPVWKLLADFTPEQIVSLIDFTYINDALTKEEALTMLKKNEPSKKQREQDLLKTGFPAYITSVGWSCYGEDQLKDLINYYQNMGFTAFKFKVGTDLEYDKKRLTIAREVIGPKGLIMVDANAIWEVDQAIAWMKELTKFNLYWIEEPTNCDDIDGQKIISDALKPLRVASGEHCQNRIMFKQFLRRGAIQFCQVDACRLGSVNEILAVLLMAKKFSVPVCPHSGGVGLSEMVQHIAIFDYIGIGASLTDRHCEYVNELHEDVFVNPAKIKDGHYVLPLNPGYSTELIKKAQEEHEYPCGMRWQQLFKNGTFQLNQQ